MNDLWKKLSLVLFCLCLFSGISYAQDGQRKEMVFYPTDVSKAGDLSYLRDSIRLMLASRLSASGEVQPLFKKKVGKGQSAFYEVKSRLIQNIDNVELYATVLSSEAGAQPVTFRAEVKDGTQIMKALDKVVADINKSFFGAEDTPATVAAGGNSETRKIDFQTPHPDRAVRRNSGYGLSIIQDGENLDSSVRVEASGRYKSAVLQIESQGMTAGDIDGDSYDEIVVATHAKIFIYQLRDRRIQHLDTISLPGGLRVHAVNVADLDNNGLMEIYLSSTRNKEPRSFVLEWSPSAGVKWLYKDVHWYLRPLDIPGEGFVLAGQQSGVSGMTQPGIYRMHFQPGENISGGERLPVPKPVNLFDFVFADLDGDTVAEVVSISRKEELLVFGADLQPLYTSPAGFGGRELGREFTAPIRLVATDFNNDGSDDILIVDNELYSPKLFNKTRLYKNGQVRGLQWDGMGFMEVWHTNLFQNAVIDFQFLSSVGTEKNSAAVKGRLFIVEPAKGDLLEGFFLGIRNSRLSVYGMDFIPKEN
ncbi:MAG TPA: VCBS repeat-containing protein [Desulfobacterales bacterium]|nr:VCBS repeat-containing protein [Desulfobacterales bacterium]HIP40405.1 VCBS repeat-containing protein [Desulfocapsa sulfexigens]